MSSESALDLEAPAFSFKPFASDRAAVLPSPPYVIGDLLTATGAQALGRIADVAVGSVLVSGGVGVAPAWSATPFATTITARRNGIAAVSTDGLIAENTTPATVGVPVQLPPRVRLSGTAFNSVSALSETDDWKIEARPISAAGATSIDLFLSRQIAGGGYIDNLRLTSGGSLRIAAGGILGWVNIGGFNAPADGQVNLSNGALSAGVGFDVTTDALLKIRTRAQTGYATVDCLGLKASGVAGFNGTVTPVTTITVVNGIVTNVA